MATPRSRIRAQTDDLRRMLTGARRDEDGFAVVHVDGKERRFEPRSNGAFVAEEASLPTKAILHSGAIAKGVYPSDVTSVRNDGSVGYKDYY